MDVNDLEVQSVSAMTDEELLEHLRRVRMERIKKPETKRRKKSTKEGTGSSRQEKSDSVDLSGISKSDAAELLALFEKE